MNSTRLIFIVITATLVMMLANQWQAANAPIASPQANGAPLEQAGIIPASAIPTDATVPQAASASAVAEIPNPTAPDVGSPPGTKPVTLETVAVETDLFKLQISLTGADIESAKLKTYSLSLADKTPVELVSRTAEHWIKTQSGLVAQGGALLPNHLSVYQAPTTALLMPADAAQFEVPFTWTDASGMQVKKIYQFTRGSFAIGVRYEVTNTSAVPLGAFVYRQLMQPEPAQASGSFFASPAGLAYSGTAVYSPDQRFEKLAPDSFAEEPFKRSFAGGWMALLQHHFFVAWIPDAKDVHDYSTLLTQNNGANYLTRQQSQLITIAPNATQQFAAQLYIGPKLQNEIKALAPGLETVVDYGMFTIFSAPLFKVLDWFYTLSKNWGVAIILIVLLIKIVFYKLSEAQYRSAARMKALSPKIEDLKRRFGDDRQKFGMAQMELFRKEKVNPFLGCLPILLQIPLLMGLYWVLAESVEMRQAPFIGWIKDLTAADPYFVLPVLNCLVMFLTSKLTPMTGMDPVQQKVMTYMPLMFGVMMAFFPAGLVLYWTFNGLLGLLQQWWITRQIEAQSAKR